MSESQPGTKTTPRKRLVKISIATPEKQKEITKNVEKLNNLMRNPYKGRKGWTRNYVQIFNLFKLVQRDENFIITEEFKEIEREVNGVITDHLSQQSREVLIGLKYGSNKSVVEQYEALTSYKFDTLIESAKSEKGGGEQGDRDGSDGSEYNSESELTLESEGNESMEISTGDIDAVFNKDLRSEDFIRGGDAELDAMLQGIRSMDGKDEWFNTVKEEGTLPSGNVLNMFTSIQDYIKTKNRDEYRQQIENASASSEHAMVPEEEYQEIQRQLAQNKEVRDIQRAQGETPASNEFGENSFISPSTQEGLSPIRSSSSGVSSMSGARSSLTPSMAKSTQVKQEGLPYRRAKQDPNARRKLPFSDGETKGDDASRNTLQEGFHPKKPLRTREAGDPEGGDPDSFYESFDEEKDGPGPEDKVSTYKNFIIGDGIPGHKSNHGVKFPYRIIYGSAAERFLLTVDFRQYEAFIRMHHPEFARTTTSLAMDKTTLARKSASLIQLFGSMIGVNVLVYGPGHKSLKDCSDQYQELLMYSLGHVLNSVVGIRAGLISRRPLNKRVRTEEDIRRLQSALGPDPAVQSDNPSVSDAVSQEYRPAKRARSLYTENPRAFNVPTPQKMQPQVAEMFFI